MNNSYSIKYKNYNLNHYINMRMCILQCNNIIILDVKNKNMALRLVLYQYYWLIFDLHNT